MKSYFKTSKRVIILILILCILLFTTVIGVHATSMPEENSATTEEPIAVAAEIIISTEESTIATEEITPEPMPMVANSCPSNYSLYYPDGRIHANVHFDHSHGGIQPHVHVYTWHQGPNGKWNSSTSCVEYDPKLYPRP